LILKTGSLPVFLIALGFGINNKDKHAAGIWRHCAGRSFDFEVQRTVLLFLSESNGKFVKVKIVQVLIP